MTRKEYADFLLKTDHDYNYYLNKYPKRELKEGQMVTRFAPSPTGFVHMGSLYTSFSDLQFAKQTNGICYLRIEDTDGKRTVENGVQGIIDDLNNFHIKFHFSSYHIIQNHYQKYNTYLHLFLLLL